MKKALYPNEKVNLDGQKGIFKLLFIIIIGIIILSYFGVDADAVVESKSVQFLIGLFISFWN